MSKQLSTRQTAICVIFFFGVIVFSKRNEEKKRLKLHLFLQIIQAADGKNGK